MHTVLVVEDNPISRKMVRVALQTAEFEVIEVGDGRSAIATLRERHVDLVLQDLVLPDYDGFELVAALRSIRPDIPIFAFSGYVSNDARLSLAGFDDVLEKPLEPSRLLRLVQAHLAPADLREPSTTDAVPVLVVDDDPIQRKLVGLRLKRLGYDVTDADDGLAALEALDGFVPAAIISDVLMPRLDGFGLCIEVRKRPELAAVPIILTTNSYVEEEDRRLATRVGAEQLVLRTPDLRELLEVVDHYVASDVVPRQLPEVDAPLVDHRLRRVTSQLERQVALHAGASRRCSLLAAELTVLRGISEALADEEDIDTAVRHTLAACFDAGGISLGAVFIAEGDGFRALKMNTVDEQSDLFDDFFGEPELLREIAIAQEAITFAVGGENLPVFDRFLARARATSAMVIPAICQKESLAVLLMMSRDEDMGTDDRLAFGSAVASQIAQALALSRAFRVKEQLERKSHRKAVVLQSILDSINEGVVVLNTDGNVIHKNAAATAILGETSAPPSDWTEAFGLFHADESTPIDSHELAILRALNGESVKGELMVVRRGEETRWVSQSAHPWTDADQRERGAVCAFRDVTQERDAQMRLMEADRMASIGLIAAGVAHEINNPLAAVAGNLELAVAALARNELDLDELRDILNDAREATDRTRHIVRDLGVFSREPEREQDTTVELRPIIESSVRMARGELRHRCEVRLNLQDVPPVLGSEARLGQVFLNMIVNAAQAIDVGGADEDEIRISSFEHDDGRVVVELSDTGAGIDESHLNQLFQPFFTTKPAGMGTGLGLAICHRIITDLGGEIEVESAVGVGTTFRIVLQPAEPPASTQRQATTSSCAPQRPARVLLIDDEELIITLAERMLCDHDVTSFMNARDGLLALDSSEAFDVIFCDLMMPDMTGMQFHDTVRRDHGDLADRIVFLTGGVFGEEARAFLDEVENAILKKPFGAAELLRCVAEQLSTAREAP